MTSLAMNYDGLSFNVNFFKYYKRILVYKKKKRWTFIIHTLKIILVLDMFGGQILSTM